MSEELKQKARELREIYLGEKHDCPCCLKRAVPWEKCDMQERWLKVAEFAAQVCEQREKVGFCEKHAPNPSQSYAGCWVCSRNEETELLKEVLRTLGWMKDKEAGWYLAEDSDAADGPKFYDFHDAVAAALDDYEVLRAAYKKSHLYGAGQLQRAEAAELALQSRDKRISELGADICNMNDSIAEIVCQDLADWDWKTCLERVKNLRAALQAKEQVLAQARQQAVAELRELQGRMRSEQSGRLHGYGAILDYVADRIRSLTPPPALTKEK